MLPASADMSGNEVNQKSAKVIGPFTGISTYVLLFMAALLISALPDIRLFLDPQSWVWSCVFPFGLFCFGSNRTGGSTLLAFIAYDIYLVLFILFCATRNRRPFFLLCAIFVCVLAVNVAGCRNLQINGFFSH